MTPCIDIVSKANIAYRLHEYPHDARSASYGAEAAEKMGVSGKRVFKTLLIALDNHDFAVCVIPVAAMLNMKRAAKAAGAKKALMASEGDVARQTGYVVGGVSPLGQKRALKTLIDASAGGFSTIYVSAGRRGLEIELHPADLQRLTRAIVADICR